MRTFFHPTFAAMLCSLSLTPTAVGLVIDDFSSGAHSSGPGIVNLDLNQNGLPAASVIGGGREAFLQYGGGFSIGNGALQLQYDQAYFEVAILGYSRDAGIPQLNADLMADGDDHLFIRINRSEYLGAHDQYDAGMITLLSDEGEASFAGYGASFRFQDSATPYTVAIPFAELSQELNLEDIDRIEMSFFLSQAKIAIEIDEISTGKLMTGDLNADGVVDSADGATFGQLYGATGPLAADANHDGVVNAADYTVWRDAMAASPATAIPEPAGVMLALLAMATTLRHRRV